MDLKALFKLYQNVVLKPEETFAKEAKKTNFEIMDGYKHFLIGGVVYFVLYIIYYIAMESLASALSGVSGRVLLAKTSIIPLPLMIVLTALSVLIAPFITVGIYYVIAAIFGGKCNFKKLFYLVSLYTAPFLLISSILLFVNFIPCLGSLIVIAVSLYGLYVLTMAIKSAYNFSTLRAVVVWLIPGLILGAILVLAAFILVGAALAG